MNCPGCQNVVPSTIIFCPYCGARIYPSQLPRRIPLNRKTILVCAAVIVLLTLVGSALFAFISFSEPDVIVSTPTVAPEPQPTQEPSPVPPTATPLPFPSLVDVFDRISPSLVLVSTSENSSSGFIVHSAGYVITSALVVEGSPQQIDVFLYDEGSYRGQLVARDTDLGLAYLKLDADRTFRVAAIGDSDQIAQGEKVIAVSYVAADTQQETSPVTIGKLSSRVGELLGIDAPLNPGNGGGPLLDGMGCVIGVNTGRVSIEGISFAIPINDVDYQMDANEGPCVPVTVPAVATKPAMFPTVSPTPTAPPTSQPTATPTTVPTATFAPQPTVTPEPSPTPSPTALPAATPIPTSTPTVTPRPTPTARSTPTPPPTRVPLVLGHARHADAHYTINVPNQWAGGRVTFFAKAYSGPPGPWAQYNTIQGAKRYDIESLKNAGVNLVGTYFQERYSSDQLCGTKGFVVIRETALVTHFPGTGIALHIDVCEADLSLQAEPGITNEDVSNNIIKSLRNQS